VVVVGFVFLEKKEAKKPLKMGRSYPVEESNADDLGVIL
jgi:hypothetical protein